MSREEYLKLRMERAGELLQQAALMLDNNWLDGAVNRIYYSIFYATSALLYTKKLYPKTHLGVKSLFSNEFIRTGLIDQRYSKYYSAVFARRFEADYEEAPILDEAEIKEMYNEAIKYVELVKEKLKEFNYGDRN